MRRQSKEWRAWITEQYEGQPTECKASQQNAKQFKALLDWHEEKRALELRISDLEAEIERLKEGRNEPT